MLFITFIRLIYLQRAYFAHAHFPANQYFEIVIAMMLGSSNIFFCEEPIIHFFQNLMFFLTKICGIVSWYDIKTIIFNYLCQIFLNYNAPVGLSSAFLCKYGTKAIRRNFHSIKCRKTTSNPSKNTL